MAERAGSTMVEVTGSHAAYMPQPRALALSVEKAAKSLGGATIGVLQHNHLDSGVRESLVRASRSSDRRSLPCGVPLESPRPW